MQYLKENYRWRICLVLFVTVLVGFYDRLNITFAIPLMAQEYGWSDQQVRDNGSLLMGIFYLGYGLANIFLTPIASRFGPRKTLLVVIVLWSLFTALGAWVSQFMMLLIATRVLLGLSEGVHFPMMAQLTKNWFTLHERAKANSIWVSGIFVAVLTAPLLLVPMMANFGWRSGFVVLALIGLVVSLPLVYLTIHDKPEQHNKVSSQERQYLADHHDYEGGLTDNSLLWQVMTKPGFLLLMAIGICNNIVALGVSSWLPTYFATEKGIPYNDIAWLVATPYVFSLFGIALWSYLGDKHNKRTIVAGVGYFMCGIMLSLALDSDTIWQVALLFSAAVFFISSYNACEFAMVQRLLPKHKVATGAGIYNGLTTMIGGGLGPVIVSPIIGDGEGTWIVSVVCAINALMLIAVYRTVKY
ncbi:MFS transporter [Thalassotalea sp. Y01]|uniref:MFS transporter n=1 Tax=Thalassotalea sp. Y01 TaxID=2729613 RepID=UPI00145E35E4|nr:MFS transporter [Thalassotalea sp. Y01]NMP16047.1 MFS transporter [Thalassotalea sp. Y01]